MTFSRVDRNIVNMPSRLKRRHGIDDLAGDINEAGHAAVGSPYGSPSVLYGTEDSHTKMLHLSGNRLRPTVVSHIHDDLGSIADKPGIESTEHILKTDWGGELHPFICFEHDAFMTRFPPVVIICQKQVIQPWHLLFIREVFSEGNQMLFPVGILDPAPFEEEEIQLVFIVKPKFSNK